MLNKNIKEQKGISRRNFLKGSTAIAATAGVLATNSNPLTAKASKASMEMIYGKDANPKPGQWSILKPEADYGGARVKYVEHNDQWLGSTQIVGEIKKRSFSDRPFYRAYHGDFGEKSKMGTISFVPRSPYSGGANAVVKAMGHTDLVDGTPAAEKLPIPDPEQMSMNIKDYAYFLNADEVGIGMTPDFAIYSSKLADMKALLEEEPDWNKILAPNDDITAEAYPYCIVISADKHLETFLGSTGYDQMASPQTNRADMISSTIAVAIAQFIRILGYGARVSHAGREMLIHTPCAIAAGMGEQTRVTAAVAHPRYGFRHKVSTILTNIPLAPDKPIEFGAKDFCRVCMKCAEACPAQAISFDADEVEYNGYKRWDFDMETCLKFRTENEEGDCCHQCIKVCPWNSKEDSWFHKAGVFIGSTGEVGSKFLVSIDDMFGYGTEIIPKYKWWIDWPELLQIPDRDTWMKQRGFELRS